MSLYNFFTPGFDPTSTGACISRSQLLQMWQEGKPAATTSIIVLADAAPNVATYPDLARCVWAKTTGGGTVLTGKYYYYDGATWQPWTIELGTLSGATFADHTIDKDKISLTGSAPNNIFAVNGAGNGFIWTTVAALINANTLPLTDLVNAAEGAGMVVYSSGGGVWGRTNLSAAISAQVADSVLDANHLYDASTLYAQYQVPAQGAVPGANFTPSYVENLLRDNQTPRKKLQWVSNAITSTAGVAQADGTLAPSFTITLTENIADFQVSLSEGQSVSIAVKQAAGSSFTVAWNGTIKWPAGTAPTMTATKQTTASYP
jgi:hypothetical protein